VCLDLQIARGGRRIPENGRDLCAELLTRCPGVRLVARTSQNGPSLRRQLLQALAGTHSDASPSWHFHATPLIVGKDEGPAAMDKVLTEAWLVHQELCLGAALPRRITLKRSITRAMTQEGFQVHNLTVGTGPEWLFRLGDKAIVNTQKESNVRRGQVLLAALAEYPLGVRCRAIFERWNRDVDADEEVNNRVQRIHEIVQHIRKAIKQQTGVADDVLVTVTDGYALLGHIFRAPQA
jgi:hypothetical protein